YFLSFFFFSSRRRHTRFSRDWSSDVCSSDLGWGAGFSGPADAGTHLQHLEHAAPGCRLEAAAPSGLPHSAAGPVAHVVGGAFGPGVLDDLCEPGRGVAVLARAVGEAVAGPGGQDPAPDCPAQQIMVDGVFGRPIMRPTSQRDAAETSLRINELDEWLGCEGSARGGGLLVEARLTVGFYAV